MRIFRVNFCVLLFTILITAVPVLAQTFSLHLAAANKPQDSRLFYNWQWFVEWDLKQNLPPGDYTVYWDSTESTKYLEGKYVNYNKSGIWTFYHLNGWIKRTVPYADGKISGEIVEYSYSGDTLEVEYYTDGVFKKSIQWNNYYGLSSRSKWPEYIWEAPVQNLAIQTYFSSEGRITSVDSHNYVTDQRHAVDFNEDGTIGYEYFENMKSHKSSSVVYPQPTAPSLVKSLSYNLNNPKEWVRLDSLKYYENLEGVSISWFTPREICKDSIELLNKKIQLLRKFDKLTAMVISINGQVPRSVFELRSLTTLEISCPCGIDKRIGNLSRLQKLTWSLAIQYPASEQQYKTLPRAISKLKQLSSLTLNSYIMKDPDKELRRLIPLKNLEVLNLYYCGNKEFPKSIAAIKSLKLLYLSGGDTYGLLETTYRTLPDTFFTMRNLRCIYLSVDVKDSTIKTYIKRLPLCMFETESFCFTGETMITMADGSEQRIDQITTGDIVLAYDFKNSRVDTSRVRHVIEHSPSQVTLIEMRATSGKSLQVTPNHPIYSGNGEFQPAAQFAAADPAYSYAASALKENRMISAIPYAAVGVPVYNIGTTKGNYFANGFLVHNK